MAEVQVIEKPQRWDVPFADEQPDLPGRRYMSDFRIAELLEIEPFCHMDADAFPRRAPLEGILRNDTRFVEFNRGEVIVRQGDYGNSAFLILEGSVRVILEGLPDDVVGRRKPKPRSWLRSLAQLLLNPRTPEVRDVEAYEAVRERGDETDGKADGKGGAGVLVEDVTNVLSAMPDAFEKTKNATMGEGQLFGELAALGRMPRTATVVADEDVRLLEIRWQGLRDLRKHDEALRRHVDEQYRRYGLEAALRNSPLLAYFREANLPAAEQQKRDDELRQIIDAAQLESYGSFDWHGTYQQLRKKSVDPLTEEPIIAAEGQYPSGVLLIRAGFARLSRKRGSGEQTFSYLRKGDIYGLAEFVHHVRHGKRVPLRATLRAVGYVDVVRIPNEIVERLIVNNLPTDSMPELPPEDGGGGAASGIDPAAMEQLVENRYINGEATMLIDLNRCTRCDDCVSACASGHNNNPRFIRHGVTIGNHMVANACMHCEDPVCMIGCPTGAIHRSEGESGEVVINDLTCIGCQTCAASCPYDNIRMVEVRHASAADAVMIADGKPVLKATKCDLCVDHHGGPACQRACPHDALVRMDMHDLDALTEWFER